MKDGCPFCEYEGPAPIEVDFGDVIVFEPLDPHGPQHRLVVPRRHVTHFDPTVVARCTAVACHLLGQGEGNIIVSVGRSATQTVPHLHVHSIGRFPNDGLTLPWGLPAHLHSMKPQPGSPEFAARYPEHNGKGKGMADDDVTHDDPTEIHETSTIAPDVKVPEEIEERLEKEREEGERVGD